jgi:predicted RNA-binding Zn ribbon-like protein
MVETSILRMPDFDVLTGNWLSLDFTHTLADRYGSQRRELLNNYSDLMAWGVFVHLFTDEEAHLLIKIAGQYPAQAEVILKRAILLREAIYRIFSANSEDALPEMVDLALLNAMLAEAMSHACLVSRGDAFVWDWTENGDLDRLKRILWLVVRSAAELLTSEKLHDVRACSAEDCRWLFLDTSKNHSRRWCDMQTCGNQAKARRHYSRKRDALHHSL